MLLKQSTTYMCVVVIHDLLFFLESPVKNIRKNIKGLMTKTGVQPLFLYDDVTVLQLEYTFYIIVSVSSQHCSDDAFVYFYI